MGSAAVGMRFGRSGPTSSSTRSRPWECLCSTGGIFGDKISTMTEDRMIARRVALDLDTCTWH
jgi:hypothetical protein